MFPFLRLPFTGERRVTDEEIARLLHISTGPTTTTNNKINKRGKVK
jgi:hypothetical protein